MIETEQAIIEQYRKTKIKWSELNRLDVKTRELIVETDSKTLENYDAELKRIRDKRDDQKIVIDDRTEEQKYQDHVNILLSLDQELNKLYKIMCKSGIFSLIAKLSPYEDKMREIENKVLFFIELQKISEEYNVQIELTEKFRIEVSSDKQPREQIVRLEDIKEDMEVESENKNASNTALALTHIRKYEILKRLSEINIKYIPPLKNMINIIGITIGEYDWNKNRKEIENRKAFKYILKKIEDLSSPQEQKDEKRLKKIRKIEQLSKQIIKLKKEISAE